MVELRKVGLVGLELTQILLLILYYSEYEGLVEWTGVGLVGLELTGTLLLILYYSEYEGLVEWTGVVLVGLELTGTLLRTARTQALQTAITATALLSDKLVADLMKPR